jgi:hypothetical protein
VGVRESKIAANLAGFLMTASSVCESESAAGAPELSSETSVRAKPNSADTFFPLELRRGRLKKAK